MESKAGFSSWLTWLAGKSAFFKRKYIFKWWNFHCNLLVYWRIIPKRLISSIPFLNRTYMRNTTSKTPNFLHMYGDMFQGVIWLYFNDCHPQHKLFKPMGLQYSSKKRCWLSLLAFTFWFFYIDAKKSDAGYSFASGLIPFSNNVYVATGGN